MHTPDLLGWVKGQALKLCRKYILIELSELIVFSYDQNDTQGGLGCWRMGFIYLKPKVTLHF